MDGQPRNAAIERSSARVDRCGRRPGRRIAGPHEPWGGL